MAINSNLTYVHLSLPITENLITKTVFMLVVELNEHLSELRKVMCMEEQINVYVRTRYII